MAKKILERAPKKARKTKTRTWTKRSDPRARRRGSGGSVATAMLNQSAAARSTGSIGAMTPTGIAAPNPSPPADVTPPPAHAVGDPDREPGRDRRGARRRR